MATLRAAERNRLPASKFGLPAQRKYPIEDRSHAAKAKGRATQMERKGRITPAQEQEIKAKANRVLGETGKSMRSLRSR